MRTSITSHFPFASRRQSESETPSPVKDVVPKARLATPEKVLEEDIDDPSAPLAQTNGTLLNGHTVKAWS